jgi:hypothetical protein
MKKEDKKYLLIGILFLFIEVIAITRNILESYIYFFWFCDFAPILFAILFFFRKPQYVKALINFGLIPQVIFLINFFYIFFLGKDLFNLFPNFFELNSLYLLNTFVLHLTTFIALLFTFKIKPQKSTFYYSLVLLVGIYLMSLIFTSPTDNINYVNSGVDLLKFSIPHYTLLWPFLVFLLLILPTQGIQYMIYQLWKRKGIKKKSTS